MNCVMTIQRFGVAVLATTVAGIACAQLFETPKIPDTLRAKAQIAKAMEIGGPDLKDEVQWVCTTRKSVAPPGVKPPMITALPKWTPAEPTQVFDNLYWLGFREIGAWVLKTSDGIILFDTLNSAEEAQTILEPAMAKFGLDPRQIRYMIISHAHVDHYGGAAYLKRKYGARIAMGAPDWDYLLKPSPADALFKNLEKPARDMAIKDGDSITVGDTKVFMFITPGHTPGSMVSVFPIKDHGRTAKVALIGGALSMHSSQEMERLRANLARYAGPESVVALINSHPEQNTTNVSHYLLDRSAPKPFAWSKDKMDRYLRAATECTTDKVYDPAATAATRELAK